jgi:molybdenum cofactor cytidylyltransferase
VSSGKALSAVAALILAAGRSTRMGPQNKLLVRDGSGQTMIERVVRAVLESRAGRAVLVTGHQAEAVEQAARQAAGPGSRLRVVYAAAYTEGLSASLKTGVATMAGETAALMCLGDMPLVTAAMLDRLIGAFEADSRKTIIVPTCGGMRGNPVLWHGKFFPAFAELSGDRGARDLLARNAEEIAEVDLGDVAVLKDFDTPESIASDWRNPSL